MPPVRVDGRGGLGYSVPMRHSPSRKRVTVKVPTAPAAETPERNEVVEEEATESVEANESPARYVQVSMKLTREQHRALRVDAVERSYRHGGPADASAIVRELVDAWMAPAS